MDACDGGLLPSWGSAQKWAQLREASSPASHYLVPFSDQISNSEMQIGESGALASLRHPQLGLILAHGRIASINASIMLRLRHFTIDCRNSGAERIRAANKTARTVYKRRTLQIVHLIQ